MPAPHMPIERGPRIGTNLLRQSRTQFKKSRVCLTRSSLIWFLLAQLLAWSTFAAAADTQHEQIVAEKVESLVARMTLTEKIGQLNLISQGEPVEEQLASVRAGRVGAMLNVVDPAIIDRYREAASQSRLKIPLLFGLDAVDVFRIAFPPPIAWAATFRPELAEAASRSVAGETAAIGVNWTFAPMVDISRDPRWGRVVEGAGEDPYLGSVMAAARVRGYLAGGLMPTAKHFVGYGAGESGRDYNGALIPTSDLYDRYLPPFQAAFNAGAQTVMGALNAINGVPATANAFLMYRVLRRDMGFKGFVTSDYNAIGELINHGLAADLAAASRLALKAGIDLDMEGYGYDRHLAAELAASRVTQIQIDHAVARILTVKFNMGLFDEWSRKTAPPEAGTRKIARQIARESFVLLKNDNTVLPIATGVKTIALIGDAAKTDFDESWYGPAGLTQPATQTLYDAMKERLAPGQSIVYEPAFADRCGKSLADDAAAVRAAERADVIVLIVTEDCEFSGEGTSRANLDLSTAQQTVLDRLSATGKPLVLVVTAGRPLTLTAAAAKAQAILYAWLPRTEGRAALAEILTGEVNPSGKLPMSLPRSVGQIPISYDVLPTSRPPTESRYTSRYLDENVTPLYPFGFGLSYTTFEYTKLRPQSVVLDLAGSMFIDVDVTNTGSRSGQEVVQLYVRRPVASRSRPIRELKGFQKIALRPGETRTVRFDLHGRALAFHDDEGKRVEEPGPVQIFVGGSSQATLSADLVMK